LLADEADEEGDDEKAEEVDLDAEAELTNEEVLKEVLGDGAYDLEHAGAEEAREVHTDAESEHSEAQTKATEIDNAIVNDYGEHFEFFSFRSKCFELEAGSYTYKVCPFDNAKQGFTSLGDWKGLTNDNTVMEFSGGQSCWNGPARSCRYKQCMVLCCAAFN
jgi:hypothetical protein